MYRVQLKNFEGPLDLLLFFIKRDELDIYDIPIHRITQQYLEQLKLMAKLDLEVAGEFVAMAATLIHIKSRMLLPKSDEESDEEVSEDPRKELVQKLLDYQRYKEASKTLYDRPLLGRDIWSRGKRESFQSDEDGEIILDDRGLFALIAGYRKAIKAFKKRVHKVILEGQSISSRIMEIKDRLIKGQKSTLRALMKPEEFTKTKLVVTFLSILELSRMGFLSLFQSEVYADIHIDTKESVERDVIARVQEYDSHDAEAVAAKIFEQETAEISFEDMEEAAEEDVTPVQQEFTPEELVADAAATDEEIAEAEKDMGLGDIEEDIEFQAEKVSEKLRQAESETHEPDILDEITAKYEGDDEDDSEIVPITQRDQEPEV